MRIAIVKTSSMGDVIHTLPVVSDIVDAIPSATIDWVVERGFAEIPRWHPAVRNILPLSIRQWRKSLGSSATWSQIAEFRRQLRESGPYDMVLDLQGLYKSALVARMIRGPRAGFSFRCAREPLAALLYERRYDVDMTGHAIERLRRLAAAAFGYRLNGLPRFRLRLASSDLPSPAVIDSPVAPSAASQFDAAGARPYAVLLHATSRAEKLWPNERWRALIAALNQRGVAVVLPWASAAEHAQARQLASGAARSVVPEAMNLNQCAQLLRRALLVVGVDTGLTHLAAALDKPTVSLFGATEAARFGPYWSSCAFNLGDRGHWPDHGEVIAALEPWLPAGEVRG